ncbi:MAG TPA: antitoxin Xre/MbcA/ParS toxin-binding domain-containing protein [Silvibacterium sp.]|nr:antitoxin Xre/MbcA/ParS toxin-binding domain-containing protein [Silvibacterium sp.]
MTIAAIAEVLGGRKAFGHKIETSSDLAEATRAGLLVDSLDRLAEELSVQRLAVAKLLGISERTLSRRTTSNARLTAAESDRVVRLARVLALAKETLGNMEKASRWLQTPNRALEGGKPIDRLDTDIGVRSVEQVLGRIEYGLYS